MDDEGELDGLHMSVSQPTKTHGQNADPPLPFLDNNNNNCEHSHAHSNSDAQAGRGLASLQYSGDTSGGIHSFLLMMMDNAV